MKKLYIYLLVAVIATASSCTYTFPEDEKPTPGSADFSKFVAVGNSITAGYTNGALYNAGQEASFVNIVATQMKLVGGGDFNQPDIDAVDGYFGLAPDGMTILGRLQLTNPASPAPAPIIPGQAITPYIGVKATLNNFGVPGIRIIDLAVAGYGTLNPYYGRFATDPATANVLADATAANSTFFSLWLGGNDALGYALAGATGNVDGDGSSTKDMTPVAMFTATYSAAIAAMTANGAKGILTNVPNINDIPHFTTVAWNAIPMDQATADAVNAGYIGFNGGINAYNAGVLPGQTEPPTIKRDTIGFSAGNNAIVIIDITIPDLSAWGIPPMRQATSDDLITLSAGGVLGTLADPMNPASVIGVGVPLSEEYTLTLANQEDIATRISDFNAVIANEVSASNGNLVLLNMNAIFADIAQNGLIINGSGMDATILPPFGAFSLDGVHTNERGAAYVASLFIDKINEAFGSNIPNINPNDWAGNALPVP